MSTCLDTHQVVRELLNCVQHSDNCIGCFIDAETSANKSCTLHQQDQQETGQILRNSSAICGDQDPPPVFTKMFHIDDVATDGAESLAVFIYCALLYCLYKIFKPRRGALVLRSVGMALAFYGISCVMGLFGFGWPAMDLFYKYKLTILYGALLYCLYKIFKPRRGALVLRSVGMALAFYGISCVMGLFGFGWPMMDLLYQYRYWIAAAWFYWAVLARFRCFRLSLRSSLRLWSVPWPGLLVGLALSGGWHYLVPAAPSASVGGSVDTPIERLHEALMLAHVRPSLVLPRRLEEWSTADVSFWLKALDEDGTGASSLWLKDPVYMPPEELQRAAWLSGQKGQTHFGSVAGAFWEAEVDGSVLAILSDASLQELSPSLSEKTRFLLLEHVGMLLQGRGGAGEEDEFVADFWDYRALKHNRFTVAWLAVAIFPLPRASLAVLLLLGRPELAPLAAALSRHSYLVGYIGGLLHAAHWLLLALFPNLCIAAAALALGGFGINFWVTWIVVFSSISSFERELVSLRKHCLPQGPLSCSSFRRLNARGLWVMLRSSSGEDKGYQQDIAWTLFVAASFKVVPWFLTDALLYASFFNHLSQGALRLLEHARTGRWLRFLLSTAAYSLPCFLFDAFRSNAFWPTLVITFVITSVFLAVRRDRDRNVRLNIGSRAPAAFSSFLPSEPSNPMLRVAHATEGPMLVENSLASLKGIVLFPGVVVRINYTGQRGIDAGGLFRDWLSRLGRALFDPRLGLMTEAEEAVDGVKHLRLIETGGPLPSGGSGSGQGGGKRGDYAWLAGVVVGLCLRDNYPLAIPLAPPFASVLRAMVGWVAKDKSEKKKEKEGEEEGGEGEQPESAMPPGFAFAAKDLRYVNLALYKACVDPSVPRETRASNLANACVTFATDSRCMQRWQQTRGGQPGGGNGSGSDKADGKGDKKGEAPVPMPPLSKQESSVWLDKAVDEEVTVETAEEYARKVCCKRMYSNIRMELKAMAKGILDVAFSHSVMRHEDWAQRVAGCLSIDFNDWKRNCTVFPSHRRNGKTMTLFWRHVEGLSQAERARLLFWVTGLRAPPLGGFKSLRNGFKVNVGGADETRLPSSHTCFHTLELPLYRSQGVLSKKLNQAVNSIDFFIA